jgi:hypothetical protein
MALYVVAAISGWVGPLLTPRIGHRGISIAGFGIVFASLLVAAAALYTGNKAVLPFAAATMLWGHYWDASNCMTNPSLVAKPEYRGTASVWQRAEARRRQAPNRPPQTPRMKRLPSRSAG